MVDRKPSHPSPSDEKPDDLPLITEDHFIVRDTAENRNQDLSNLLTHEPRFSFLKTGSHLVVDIGPGALPVATIPLFDSLRWRNRDLRFQAVEIPQAIMVAHIHLGHETFSLLDAEAARNQSSFKRMIPEHVVDFIVGVNELGEIKEVTLGHHEERGAQKSIAYRTIGADKPLRGRGGNFDHGSLIQDISDLLGGGEGIRQLLEQAEQGLPVAGKHVARVELQPLVSRLKRAGAELVVTEHIGESIKGASLITASYVFLHVLDKYVALHPEPSQDSRADYRRTVALQEAAAREFYSEVFKALKDGGVFVMKNHTERGFLLFDVIRKVGRKFILEASYKNSFPIELTNPLETSPFGGNRGRNVLRSVRWPQFSK